MGALRKFLASYRKPEDYILRYDFNGDLLDKSVNALHGIGSGSYTFETGRKGLANECIQFTAGCVKTPLNLPINNDQATVCFWMQNQVASTATQIITELSPNAGSNNSFLITANEGAVNRLYGVSNGSGGLSRIISDGNVLSNWNHISVVFDRRNGGGYGEVKFFVNGIYANSSAPQANNNDSNFGNFPLFIGQRNASSLPLKAKLQEFKVFNRALNSGELKLVIN